MNYVTKLVERLTRKPQVTIVPGKPASPSARANGDKPVQARAAKTRP